MEGIGPHLREERERLGFTQVKFARVGGVAANAQGHYENGKRSPRVDYLAKLATAGLDVGYVITGEVQRPTRQHESAPVNDVESETLGNARFIPAGPATEILLLLCQCLRDTADAIDEVTIAAGLVHPGCAESHVNHQLLKFHDSVEQLVVAATMQVAAKRSATR